MKRCPNCSRTFTDVSLNFCLEDGTPLVNDTPLDPGATLRYTDSRLTTPPATEIYPPPATSQSPSPPQRQEVAASVAGVSPVSKLQPGQWSPVPPMPPRKKSHAVWWILGGIVVAGIIVIGLAFMILALVSMGSDSNVNTNANTRNSNSRVANRNANTKNANTASNANNSNANSNAGLPATMTDDFSEETWDTGSFPYGDVSYEDGYYRMRGKENSYLVMYAPSNEYSTENATVRVSVQDVDGRAVPSGFGLIVHGKKSATSALEDYALLIFTGKPTTYRIIKHKAGVETTVVPSTQSSAIRAGANSNQLEIRAKGSELAFYINGQYVNRISDNRIKQGVAGFYTSGASEVAFDDLEIKR